LNVVILLVGIFLPFPRYICRRCVFIHLLHMSLVCLFWVCWVRGSISGVLGHFFFLRGAPLCGVSGRYNLFEH
jgi:hypothetical protein